MTLKIQRSANDGVVIFTLTGRIQAEHLPDLNDLFELEGADQRIVLDLQEVKLIDRDAVKFLTQCEDAGARLDNCPAYIREWVWKERKAQCSDEKET
jgi:anti-anti-sigma regulatory factor